MTETVSTRTQELAIRVKVHLGTLIPPLNVGVSIEVYFSTLIRSLITGGHLVGKGVTCSTVGNETESPTCSTTKKRVLSRAELMDKTHDHKNRIHSKALEDQGPGKVVVEAPRHLYPGSICNHSNSHSTYTVAFRPLFYLRRAYSVPPQQVKPNRSGEKGIPCFTPLYVQECRHL